MTDLALTTNDVAEPTAGRRRRMVLLLVLPVLAALAGGASTYFGLWSPLSLIGGAHHGAADEPEVVFVPVPPINVTLPDLRPRLLHLIVTIETTEAGKAKVEHLQPRVTDAFNTFLTGIAPAAFDRRGILEIIREELTTRARLAIGADVPVEVLVTEFALK
ncbi:flagellar basal body protein FliL [Paracoccus suum]|uniref:Flagellar protein FliL n=1 Tax=Paracoccus suum TaxID=2259340 RepID=A0A344PI30_9RHOB|nr:flagellar basal body-associated FliL family protein [Paracoccus suum]AXC49035.1 flagellar basal body protein FliL [Paracoccus suum]